MRVASRQPHVHGRLEAPRKRYGRSLLRENFALLDARDTVKFVCGGEGDLVRMLEVSRELGLPNRVPVYLSPVFGRLDPARIVDFMQDNNLIWATAQLQLHKIIWPGVEKGV